MVNVEYLHKPAFAVIGFTRLIDPKESATECPRFWKECFTDRFGKLFETGNPADDFEKAVLDNGIGEFGACISTCNDNMNYMIAGEYRGGYIPEGMKVFRVPESNWAVFYQTGPVAETIQGINSHIWTEWYLEEGIMCNPCGDAVFERFFWEGEEEGICRCEVWVQIMHAPDEPECNRT